MKLCTIASWFVLSLVAACAGGEPGEAGDEAAKAAACPGVDCPNVRLTTEPTKHPAKVTVPDIKLSLSKGDFDAWSESAKKWFIDGEHVEEDEMSGQITLVVPGRQDLFGQVEPTDAGLVLVLLSPDMKTEIGRVALTNDGLKGFSKDDTEANSEKTP